ncbi:BIG/ATPase V1 complex, subunit S1 [Plectosphaerella cucumerina]|uniref:Protein BIG1 n=1 Tax=Plectosphaerella cucumerina TaxID=40658 RepID=A0A8K0TLN4_9PEZI|nr:BIG/ATPase V1 complex, subunit S1 [Plectosphaerella cucumerina]
MRLSPSSGLLALAATANAFADTSPFVYLSTEQFDAPANDAQLQTGRQVVTSIKSILESCPNDHYQIVSQPNAAAADIRTASGCGVPNLCKAVEDSRVKGTFSVAEVVGQIDRHELEEYIQAVCAKKGKTVTVSETKLPALSTKDHAAQLADNDYLLRGAIEEAQSSKSYSVLYLTSPGESATYEADFGNSMSDELKRLRARVVPGRRAENGTEKDTRPLFEKYQFFTPGIFHGLLAVFFLFSVLFVGIRALASLEVSYGAFDKEMAPAAQKKQN